MDNPVVKDAKSVRASNKPTQSATQLHLRIAEIRDNTIVLKNGGLRGLLKVSSINFNLKSEQEQNAIIYSYQAFLNTLEFPVQIVIRSRKLDLDKYIDKLRGIADKQTNILLQKQTKEYAEYIQKLIEYADIMEKEFYVVVSMDPPRVVGQNFLQKFWDRMHPADSTAAIVRRHQEFENLKKGLSQRLTVIGGGLENCGLKVEVLTTSELIALFYQIYNPITSRNQKVEDARDFDIASDATLGR